MVELAIRNSVRSPVASYKIDKVIYSNLTTGRAFYKVKHAHLPSSFYGMKVIKADDRRQEKTIKNEIVALNRLPFGITAKCHHHWQDENKHFLIMDWIEGTPLSEYINSNTQSSILLQQKITISEKIARKVHQLHRFRLLHRDIKPENIILQFAGRNVADVYLIDFGSSNQSREAEEGSYHFRSPEQSYARNVRLSEASDVFSLCQVLTYIFTGSHLELEPNFDMTDWASEFNKQFSSLPNQLEELLRKGLLFKAHSRTQQAQTIANQLRQISRIIR